VKKLIPATIGLLALATVAVPTAFVTAFAASGGGCANHLYACSNGNKAAFFTNGTGTGGWVHGNDPLVPHDNGQVIQLSSPAFLLTDSTFNYAGFVGHGIDGLPIADITALSYDFQVTTPGWTIGGNGSPRLVVELSDGGNVQLLPVTTLTTGTWVHMDAMTGAVDNVGGSGIGCGSYQITWPNAVTCHAGTTVLDAFLVNDSGWAASSGLTVQIDNLTLNDTVYSHPGTSKR
jgi:hypothetical protein